MFEIIWGLSHTFKMFYTYSKQQRSAHGETKINKFHDNDLLSHADK